MHNAIGKLFSGAVLLLVLGWTSARAAIVNVNCVGNTSDTTTLNNAISGSGNGDEIRIHGSCAVNSTIVLLANRSYIGDSRTGTVIQQANGVNLTAVLASDSWNCNSTSTGSPIRIAHLTIDGNSSHNTGTSDLVIRSWLTVIEDLQVENAAVDGIQITNLSKNGTALTGTQVNGRISNVYVQSSGQNGIHVVDTGNSITDWDLMDSWVADSGYSGISLDNAAGWKIRGIHVYGVPQNAIWANRCYATSIQDNYIEDFGSTGGSGNTWFGIGCSMQGGSTASLISNNRVFQGAEPSTGNFVYIGTSQVNYGTAQLAVVGNVIKGASSSRDTGLNYQAGSNTMNVVSASNNVQQVNSARTVGSGVTLVTAY